MRVCSLTRFLASSLWPSSRLPSLFGRPVARSQQAWKREHEERVEQLAKLTNRCVYYGARVEDERVVPRAGKQTGPTANACPPACLPAWWFSRPPSFLPPTTLRVGTDAELVASPLLFVPMLALQPSRERKLVKSETGHSLSRKVDSEKLF